MHLLHSYRTMCIVLKIIHSTLSWNKYIGKRVKKQKQTKKILATMAGTPTAPSPAWIVFAPLPGWASSLPEAQRKAPAGVSWAHSLLTLVLQECRTALKRRGSCSRGTFTIFPGKKKTRISSHSWIRFQRHLSQQHWRWSYLEPLRETVNHPTATLDIWYSFGHNRIYYLLNRKQNKWAKSDQNDFSTMEQYL